MRRAVVFAGLALGSLCLACGPGPRPSPTTRGDIRIDLPGLPEPVRTAAFDFGQVPVGSSKVAVITLVNVGEDIARVLGARFEDAAPGSFFAEAPPSIPAGGRETMRVTFSPSMAGEFSARMVIDHDGETFNANLNVTGEGT